MRITVLAVLSGLAVVPAPAPDLSSVLSPRPAAAPRAWRQIPGLARDIAIGANGIMWDIGGAPAGGGFEIFRWSGNSWVGIPGGAARIGVDGDGYAWVVNDAGNIFRYNGSGWDMLPGLGRDIAGGGGAVWLIGTNPTGGGYGIYRWTGSNWANVPGGAERIAVDPAGNAWVVNNAGNIFRWNGGDWQGYPGLARDIGVGADGTVWIIGMSEMGAGGYDILRWAGGSWVGGDGAAVGVTVDQAGRPFVVARDLTIWFRE